MSSDPTDPAFDDIGPPLPPLAKDCWKRPNLADRLQGDTEAAPLYLAVGQALSTWAYVEEVLTKLFLVVARAEEKQTQKILSQSFGSIESVTVRLSLITAAIPIHYGQHWGIKQVKDEYRSIESNVQKAGYIRNDIAHGKVEDVASIDLAQNKTVHYGWFLFASDYATSRNFAYGEQSEKDFLRIIRSHYRFTAEDINSFRWKFHNLTVRISEFAKLSRLDETGRPKLLKRISLSKPTSAGHEA